MQEHASPKAGQRDARGAPILDRIRVAQVATLYRNVSISVVAAGVAAAVLAFSLAQLEPGTAMRGAAWAATVCLLAGGHLALAWRRQRAPDADARWPFWSGCFAAVALAEGAAWSWASLFLAGAAPYDLHLLVMLVCYGVAGGSLSAFGSHLPTLWCFFLPTAAPFALANLLGGTGESFTVGVLATIYVLGIGALARRIHAEFNDGLRLRFEVDALAQAVARQRDLAEAANLAKSRFLAAASHDLRQPVHALSLTIGALQEMSMPAEARVLVDHVGLSIETLDGLFGALLDISRLDAAVVVPDLRVFPVQPVIDRVCREHAMEAASKGVALRTVPCSLHVRSDPVLFERILRNLVANAVRYTDQGRVLVGCRQGSTVRLAVCDTGRGIAPEMQDRVFEEYIQVGNPQRDRSAGLGLGLAIVRRLVGLLEHELTLRSVPGRGSVFTLSLPGAAPPAPAPRILAGPAARPQGGLILVIDDEPAICLAMVALLSAWGHQVIAAGSGAEMLDRLAHCPVRPGLLICDYRLRDGESGIDTVERLQSEYNDDLPALLVTGDTAPERLLEASASGLTLLHKPVEHRDLRLAVDAALGRAGASAAWPGAPRPPGSG